MLKTIRVVAAIFAAILIAVLFAQPARAAFKLEPRVWVTTTTTGTGDLTLGAAQTGYRAFSAVMANGDTIWYTVVNAANTAEWEQGIGTWNTGNTFSRTTVLASSNAGAAVNFSAGTKNLFSDLPPSVMNFSGDGTLSSAGALTITKTSGASFTYFATGTDAANLTGTVACARFPALTGDVTSSAGGCATVLGNIPTATTAAGSVLFTAIAAPGTPAAGKASVYIDSTSKNIAVKDDAGTIKHGVQTKASVASNYLTAISDAGVVSAAQPACSDLSNSGSFCAGTDAANLTGNLAAGRLPALTGDVTSSAGSAATTLANIPTAVPAAGSILFTNIVAPGTPASGKTSVYVDSTGKVLSSKNDAGTVSVTVVPDSGASNNFLTAISAAGAISKAQPSFSNLSGAATTAQLPGTPADDSIIVGDGSSSSTWRALANGVLKYATASNTFSAAACGDLSNGATGCSTATGTSGGTIPLLNGTNTWSGAQSFNSGDLILKGATSGTITLNAAATAGSNTLTLPAGTTDFSATGGASQVVKQTSSGGALTVARLACSDLSDSSAFCSGTAASSLTGSLANTAMPGFVRATTSAVSMTAFGGL